MRATVEHQESWPSLTPVEVIVVLGKEDLTIKISDRGGWFWHIDLLSEELSPAAAAAAHCD